MNDTKTNEVSFCQYLPPKTKTRKLKKERKPSGKSKSGKEPKQVKNSSAFLATPSPTGSTSGKGRNKISRRTERSKKDTENKVNVNDYNVFHIDAKIREKLLSKISTLDKLHEDLQKTLWILNHGDDPVDRIMARTQASLLRRRMQDLESTFELVLYSMRTEDILRDYRSLLSSTGALSFVTLEPNNKVLGVSKSSELISRYLCIAQEYIEIDNLQYHPEKLRCPACQGVEFKMDDENSTYICTFCFTEIDVLDDTPSFKDTDRVNMSSRYTYTKRGHFVDAMKRFQGTQNTDPQKIKNVVDILLVEMERHNLKKNSDNRKEQVTKDHLYMFLYENKLSGYYDDINLLYHIITGEPCPNISEYEDTLLDLFEKQEYAYRQVQDPDRINSLNVNYKLYKLLQKVGYPCKKDDFYILKTKNKEDEHDEVLRRAWEESLGWLWIFT
ncbi:hypothetical protein DRO61_03165 [Candidatus Bathyarchaeota archaeon]|nr:MAG: hypothetical protein DRO61_03165 [Candidatus Bathyarchaeota archaeon]